jgi:hypothetical protein
VCPGFPRDPAASSQRPHNIQSHAAAKIHPQDPRNFTEVARLKVQDPRNFTEVARLKVQDPRNFTDVVELRIPRPRSAGTDAAERRDGTDLDT